MNITRYDMDLANEVMNIHKHGDYVLYIDHVDEVQLLKDIINNLIKEKEDLQAQIDSF
jgi:hypothetical protein